MLKKKDDFEKFPKILIYCNNKSFINTLINKLELSGFITIIVSKSKNISKEFSKDDNAVFFSDYKNVKYLFSKIDYLIYISDNNKSKLNKETQLFKEIINRYNPKSIFLYKGIYNHKLSKKNLDYFNKHFEVIKKLGLLVFYGDILSNSNEVIGIGELQKKLVAAALGKKIIINKDSTYYPLLIDELVDCLRKMMFSLETSKDAVFISGRRIKGSAFLDIFKKEKIKISKKSSERFIFPHNENITSKRQSKRLIKKVLYDQEKYKENLSVIKRFFRREECKCIKKRVLESFSKIKKRFYANRVKPAKISVLLFISLPGVLILITSILLFLTKIFFNEDYIKPSYFMANTSLTISEVNQGYIENVKKLPFLDNYFKIYDKPSLILYLQSSSAVKGIKIYNIFLSAVAGIYENKRFNNQLFKDNVLEFESLYKNLGLLEIETKDTGGLNAAISKLFLSQDDLRLFRNNVLLMKNLTKSISEKYDEGISNNYAIIFQDNSILRPTGGLIETVLLFSSETPKSEENLVDVAQIDRKITGDIEPPMALKKYFGEEYWFLKDFNWNPNFAASAEKIEVLLNKELDLNFNGVISVDKNFIYSLYEITNNSFDQSYFNSIFMDRENIDNYTDDSFSFPFTKLIQENSKDMRTLSLRKKSKILKLVYKALNEKNIQIFFNDDSVNEDVLNLGWGGSITKGECEDSCYAENISIIESTIEGNSEIVNREAQLSVSFEEGILKRDLTFYIENQNTNSYKAYIRLFVNNDVGFSPVKILYPEKDDLIEPEVTSSNGMKEAGVFVEVEPGETLGVNYFWEGEFANLYNEHARYEISWKKQAGVLEYPIEISIKTPKEGKLDSNDDFTLTGDGLFIYNTSLDRDINPSIFW